MKREMAKNLDSRYQEPIVKEMLDFACFADLRFKSMPFLDANERDALHEDFVAEVIMHVFPDGQEDENLDFDGDRTWTALR